MSARYEVYEDKKGDWRFRLRAGNGEIVGRDSEEYRDLTDALRGAHDHQAAAERAEFEIVDEA